tara:strand:+ start:230 stop:463 length:234 start_codon:yes stop_codon:yes gene_type:complete
MEIIISSLVGAIGAILVAYINTKVREKKRDALMEEITKKLHIDSKNVYIINTKKNEVHNFKYESKASTQEPFVFFIK